MRLPGLHRRTKEKRRGRRFYGSPESSFSAGQCGWRAMRRSDVLVASGGGRAGVRRKAAGRRFYDSPESSFTAGQRGWSAMRRSDVSSLRGGPRGGEQKRGTDAASTIRLKAASRLANAAGARCVEATSSSLPGGRAGVRSIAAGTPRLREVASCVRREEEQVGRCNRKRTMTRRHFRSGHDHARAIMPGVRLPRPAGEGQARYRAVDTSTPITTAPPPAP